MDGRLPCRPSNKHNHHGHGGAVCCYSGMAVANESPLPLGSSSEGVERGRNQRVLFNNALRLR